MFDIAKLQRKLMGWNFYVVFRFGYLRQSPVFATKQLETVPFCRKTSYVDVCVNEKKRLTLHPERYNDKDNEL